LYNCGKKTLPNAILKITKKPNGVTEWGYKWGYTLVEKKVMSLPIFLQNKAVLMQKKLEFGGIIHL